MGQGPSYIFILLTNPELYRRQRTIDRNGKLSGFHLVSLGVVSGAALALELLLIRIFSITHWAQFAYLIVGIALLGGGASATLLVFLVRLNRKWDHCISFAACIGFALSSILSYPWIHSVDFDPLRLIWDPRQLLVLFQVTVILTLPFLFGGILVGWFFSRHPERSAPIYAVNLVGSALGVFTALAAMSLCSPLILMRIAAGIALLASITFALSMPGKVRMVGIAALAVSGIAVTLIPLPLRFSQFKPLALTLAAPDASVVEERFSPLGAVHRVRSPLIRIAPGLSFNYLESVPVQEAIFIDADSPQPISPEWSGYEDFRYLDFTTEALPFHVRDADRTLILGAGTGSAVMLARLRGAGPVTGVEMDPIVVAMTRNAARGNSPFDQEEVRTIIESPRAYLNRARESFDLILLPLTGGPGAGVGLNALSENFLHTVESYRRCLALLSPTGICSVSFSSRMPPRESLKASGMIRAAMEAEGIAEFYTRVLAIRSWATVTILFSRLPFSEAEMARVRQFCDDRSFDLVYLNGLKEEEANQWNWVEDAAYFKGFHEIMGPDPSSFRANYIFDISPAGDNRPYFFHFMTWKSIRTLFREAGRNAAHYLEWGGVAQASSLIAATAGAVIFILLPLFGLRKTWTGRGGRTWTLIYFAMLGLGYMAFEIACIQRLTLLLGHPTYSFGIVIGSFLIGSGIGSLISGRFSRSVRTCRRCTVACLLIIILITLASGRVVNHFAGSEQVMRILISIVIVLPASIAMGMPFPMGLGLLGKLRPALIPWAWGINGCLSVVGALASPLISLRFSLPGLAWIAAGCYVIAAAASTKKLSTETISEQVEKRVDDC